MHVSRFFFLIKFFLKICLTIKNLNLNIIDNLDEDSPFVDTAAIIKNLDLVITSDTSILHLSASLNIETWGMLSLHPDWRWGEFNKINPYKTLRIFQQEKFNDWSNVEDQVYNELKKKVDLKIL